VSINPNTHFATIKEIKKAQDEAAALEAKRKAKY
jgi:hypothetical protein